MKLPLTIIEYRRTICHSCEYYNSSTNCCLAVAKPNTPHKTGFLDHPAGLSNPKAQCPKNYWLRFYAYHVYAASQLGEIPESLIKRLNSFGIDGNMALQLAILFREANPSIRLSKYYNSLLEISNTKNNFDYLERFSLSDQGVTKPPNK